MSHRLLAVFSFVIVAVMALSACAPATAPAAPAAPAAPVQVEVTRIVAGTPEVQVITATAAPATAASAQMAAGSVQVNAGGATFPLPLYQQWIFAYQVVDPSVVINYQGIGSGGGKKSIIDGTFDYAGSDSVLSDAEYTSGKDLQMYPVVAGAVVPVYNIKFSVPAATVGKGTPTAAAIAFKTLILDRQTLVDIYNAKITMWNDAAIVTLNPDLKAYLPAAKITVVHRSDSSGTTEIFTKALAAFSADWKAGGASAVQWPVDKAGNGVGGKGNPGVAAAVINTPNSIGYVELNYALQNSMSYATLVNKAGKPIVANADSLNSAMSDFGDKFTDKLTNTIVDGAGAGSWPIAGYTYVILHTTSMQDCTKAQKILEYIKWSITDATAASGAKKLGYSVLPAAVQAQVLKKLGEVTCSGKAVLGQ